MPFFDAVVLGAGAAGLHCAAVAGQRGLSVLLVDHAEKVAEKIRISGGGRCNFTNRTVGPENFLSENPRFCLPALAGYTPHDFIALVKRHRIAFHEKHKGQLFCDGPSEAVVRMLLAECEAGGVTRWQPCAVSAVQHGDAGFALETDRGSVRAAQLVVATGGLSVPKIGATDFGHRLARQFGHRIVEPRPGLVPLTFDAAAWAPFAALSGLAVPARVAAGPGTFLEDVLFTHRGLSGPGILQISSHWRPGEPITLDLAPEEDVAALLVAAKTGSRRQLHTVLGERLPKRLADTWLALWPDASARFLAEVPDRLLREIAARLQRWELLPSGTEGYRKAEVTVGGVDTRELHPSTLESRRVVGLHFVGEVVDVTGWLGGYNFQWAWASAVACGRALHAA